ncbi:hypothetical protein JTB14_008997 [Gonioctena quinquepunctata]|nr:hypothetical protein JTB14_008997 [Gonioctena quinquepunctata]
MVQEIQMQEEGDPAYSYRGPSGALKVIRGKGCEESFRAAVVDPNHRSEIGAKKHWLLDGPMDSEREIDGFNNVRGAPRQSSLNAAMDNKSKSAKKKQGIFKGIGSMFRFGKHRKIEFSNPEPAQHYHHTNEFDSNANLQQQQQQEPTTKSQQPFRQIQDPNHASPKQPSNANCLKPTSFDSSQNSQSSNSNTLHPRFASFQSGSHHSSQGSQREQQIQREPLYQRHGFVHRHAEQVQVIPENSVVAPPPIKYRQNSSEHRRNERELHKQRMAQRHTYYQIDDREDPRPLQRVDPSNQFVEYGRPGSRSGITESVPFTHYVNYKELQNHLSRKQHQYHSQRQSRPDNQLRPVSNYYEYETIQSVLNNRQRQNVPHVNTIPSQQPPPYQDPNSNSLPRNQPVQGRHPSGRGSQSRGPFVTQVTIGDHQKNGTKV